MPEYQADGTISALLWQSHCHHHFLLAALRSTDGRCRREIWIKSVAEVWYSPLRVDTWNNNNFKTTLRGLFSWQEGVTRTRSTARKWNCRPFRIIVAFCIEHGKDYGLAVETNKVFYQQIYSWVWKYEEYGAEEFVDRRDKAKTESELTEADRLRMENKLLIHNTNHNKKRIHRLMQILYDTNGIPSYLCGIKISAL